jgi:integrase
VARRKKNVNGEGSKARRRKDGRYETRAVLDTPVGRKRVSFYGATATEANAKKIEALANQNRGVLFSDPKDLTIAEYLTRWLSDTARYQVSEGTFLRYERTCRNHLSPFFGRLRLRDLTPAHMRAFKARKIEEGLDPNTVGVMQGVLNGALNQAVDDGLLPANPAARVKKATKRGETPMRALSHEEASRLISAAEGTRDEALVTLALRTGMRQGELAALPGRTSISRTRSEAWSSFGARRIPESERASPPRRPAKSAGLASGLVPLRSSKRTRSASSRRGWRLPRRRTPA